MKNTTIESRYLPVTNEDIHKGIVGEEGSKRNSNLDRGELFFFMPFNTLGEDGRRVIHAMITRQELPLAPTWVIEDMDSEFKTYGYLLATPITIQRTKKTFKQVDTPEGFFTVWEPTRRYTYEQFCNAYLDASVKGDPLP